MKKTLLLIMAICLAATFADAITIGGTIHLRGRKGHCFKRGEGCEVDITIGLEIPIDAKLVSSPAGHLYIPGISREEALEIDFSDRAGESCTLAADNGRQYKLTFGSDKGVYNPRTKSVDLIFKSVAVAESGSPANAGNTAAKKCPNPNWNRDAYLKRLLLSLGLGVMRETGGNVPVSSGQTVGINAAYRLRYLDRQGSLSLWLAGGGRWGNSTVPTSWEPPAPFSIDGQAGTPTVTATGGSVNKTLMWELGAQISWQLKNFVISPAITGGILNQSSETRRAVQTSFFNGQTYTYELSSEGKPPATQAIFRPKLRIGYGIGRLMLYAEGAWTLGAAYSYESTSFRPQGSVDAKGMYNIDQMLGGRQYTETKTGRYSAQELSIGVCFGIGGRKGPRIPDANPPPYNPYGGSPTAGRGVQPDGAGDSAPRLPGTKAGSITIAQKEEVTWNDPVTAGALGFSGITFSPGNYTVVKEEAHPYGVLTLDVKSYETLNKAPVSNRSITTVCVLRGGQLCNERGWRCLVVFPYAGPQMSVEPVLDENHILRRLKLTMLTPLCLNVWEDPSDPEHGGCTNSRNPFDRIGRQHNAALEGFIAGSEYGRIDLSRKGAPGRATDFIEDWLLPRRIDHFDAALVARIRKGKSPLDLLESFHVSPVVKRYAAQAFELVKGLPGNGMPAAADFAKMFEFENAVLANPGIPQADKEQILKISACGRYSMYFWRYYNCPAYKKVSGNPPAGDEAARKIDWYRLAGVDMMTAIGGPDCAAACSIVDFLFQAAGK